MAGEPELTKLGIALETVRGCLGYTQTKMVNLMGYRDKNSYTFWITGQRQVPHNSTVRLVMAGLNPSFLYDMNQPMLITDAETFRANASEQLNEAIEEMMRRLG